MESMSTPSTGAPLDPSTALPSTDCTATGTATGTAKVCIGMSSKGRALSRRRTGARHLGLRPMGFAPAAAVRARPGSPRPANVG